MPEELLIRKIKQEDNASIAKIIRQSLVDFNAAKPGTVYYDDTTDHLYELFQKEGSVYFIAEWQGEMVGGAGIYPTNQLPAWVCELVKLYLRADARGKGWGKLLMESCLEAASAMGYEQVYLETMPELNIAVPLYEKYGFAYLSQPMGQTHHGGCDIWMLKPMKPQG